MNPEPTAPIEVLIVEDSATQLLLLQRILVKNGFRVTTAVDGQQAWEILANYRPVLIITDIQMPVMDGYELCSRIKEDKELQEIPVILLTSLSAPEDVIHGLECGADNFIVKPYEEAFLLSRIEFVLANLELRQQAEDGATPEIFFAGRKYRLTSGRVRSIDLLLSTYETAVQKNIDLTHAKSVLQAQAAELREKNTQMEADLEMARELQTAFLPRVGLTFPLHLPPAKSALVFHQRYTATASLCGDFFDIFPLSSTEVGVFICDVMGHGVRASLLTAVIRGLVEESKPVARDPSQFLTQMNRHLFEILKQSSTLLFATACYVIVDVTRGELRYATAGHPRPLHFHAQSGSVAPLSFDAPKKGAGLGILEQSTYPSFSCPIKDGDRLLIFTDGLYEVEDASGQYYEVTQLADAIAKRAALPTEQLLDDLMDEIKAFSVNKSFEDDVCLVAIDIARLGAAHPSPSAS